MRKDGVGDYERFAREVLDAIRDRPISFEVLSDEMDDMERQARKIASWGENANVKIPITNTRRVSSMPLVGRLARDGIKVNVTGVTTLDQVTAAGEALAQGHAFSIVSVFGGRIADTGRDPVPMMAAAAQRYVPWPTWSCCGPVRASCSTSFRLTPLAATSSRSPLTFSRSCPWWAKIWTSTRWRRCRCFATMR